MFKLSVDCITLPLAQYVDSAWLLQSEFNVEEYGNTVTEQCEAFEKHKLKNLGNDTTKDAENGRRNNDARPPGTVQ